MPCDSLARTQRERQLREAALKELEADIAAGRRTLVRNLRGEVAVLNWGTSNAARAGWCEGCALAQLAKGGSWVVRSKLAAVGVRQGASFVAASHNGHPHKVGR